MKIPQDAHDLLNEPSAVKWVPLSALKAGEFMSCIDGRHAECIVATPGGDLGVFIAVMTAIEAQHGPLETGYIINALDTVMEWHSRFYMHTDVISVTLLLDKICERTGYYLAPGLTPAEFITRPPVNLRPDIAPLLTDPEFVGCGFLKALLQDPQGYGVRKLIVETAIQSFYQRLWAGSPDPYFEVLEGEHEEQAILFVDTRSHDESPTSFVPALRGKVEGPSRLFINHRPARQFLGHESLRLLAHAGELPHDVYIDTAMAFMDQLCDVQLIRILDELAPHLPRFDVTFDTLGENPRVAERT